MNSKSLSKAGALGGILYVVLQMTGQMLIQVGGQEPSFSAGQEEIVSFFLARNPVLAQTGTFLSMLAFIPFIFFLGVLWDRLKPGKEMTGWLPAITLGAGFLIVAIQLIGGAGWTIEFYRMGEPRISELTRFQFDYGNFLFAASWVMMASMLITAGISGNISGTLPKWVGWFGWAAALGLIIASGFWFSPSGAIFVPVMLFWTWLIIVSIVLFRGIGKE